MSAGPPPLDRASLDARLAAARGAAGRAATRLTGTIADFFLADDARLDERTRHAVAAVLAATVGAVETDIRRHAARILAGRGADARAEALLQGHDEVVRRLARAGLLRDRRLMDELLARVRADLVAEALPIHHAAADRPSLLIRLADVDDSIVAAAARALLAAEARRRTASDNGTPGVGDLTAERHHQLVWWSAACIREASAAAIGEDAAVDRAIVEAAHRSLGAHDEGARAEAVAMRLAAAIDARADELGPLLLEALADRRLLLFIAVLGRAIDLDFDVTREILLEPEGDRLWLALRAAGLDRPTIAQIALALADADPRRNIEQFADELDAIAAVPIEAARSALAPLTLHHDLRAAIDALTRDSNW
jgi:hypothetical protein